MTSALREKAHARVEILAHHLRVDAETVVAPVALHAAAQGLNLGRDFFGGLSRGALKEHLGHEERPAIVLRGFRQHPPLEHSAEFDERQAMVLLDEQAQSIRKIKFLDRVVAEEIGLPGCFGSSSARQQCVEGPVLGRQILAGDALEGRGGGALDGFEVAGGEIQIVGGHPTSAQVLGLALHGFAAGQVGGGKLFDRLGQFSRRGQPALHALHFGQHGLARGVELVRFDDGAHAEQAGVARGISPSIHRGNEPLFLAHLLVKPRTAAAAQQRGQNIEQRNVRMAQLRDMPAKVEMTHLDRRFLDHFAGRDLLGLRRKEGGRHGSRLRFCKGRPNLGFNSLGVDVADDDEEQVVRRVLLAVIIEDIIALHFIVDVGVADDSETIGASGVSGFEQAPRRPLARIVMVHVHFPEDDLLFLRHFVSGESGILDDIAEDVDGHGGAGVGNVNPIDRPVEGGVGIHVTACVLDLLVDASGGPVGCALKKHVFEHVGKAPSQPFALINAAGLAPRLRGNDRGAMVLANN